MRKNRGSAVAEAQRHLGLKPKSRITLVLETIANTLKPKGPIGPREKVRLLKDFGPEKTSDLLDDITKKRNMREGN